MIRGRCNRHQIELARKYFEDNYKQTAMEKEHIGVNMRDAEI